MFKLFKKKKVLAKPTNKPVIDDSTFDPRPGNVPIIARDTTELDLLKKKLALGIMQN